MAGGTKTNVTLACALDLSNVPPNVAPLYTGTTCTFNPASVTPEANGTTTILTIAVPVSAPYGAVNVTVTSKTGSPAPLAPTIFVLFVAAQVAVNPTATYRSDTVTLMSVEVNLTYAPASSGFLIGIFYNNTVLQFQSLDYSGGVLGSDAFVSQECVDGAGPLCNAPDLTYDGVGVVSLNLATASGANTTNAPNGKLFSVTFSITGKGFSAIHFVHQEVFTHLNKTDQALHTVGADGYFANKECGTGNLCKPPVVTLTLPLRPIALRPTIFNATAMPQNPGAFIKEYNWTFRSGLDLQHINRNTTSIKPLPWNNVTFTFLNIGEHEVTISVQDNYGARVYYTAHIDVFRVWIDMGISDLTLDHTVGIFPGTVVHMVATASNLGVNPENSTLRLSINDQIINTILIVNLGPTLKSSLMYDWHTAGLIPRVYRVQVNLDEVRNATTGQILENDTAIIQGKLQDPNNVRLAFIQLVEPIPSGIGVFLGLTLPETLGLGIVLVAVAVFATGLVRKSRARNPEPL